MGNLRHSLWVLLPVVVLPLVFYFAFRPGRRPAPRPRIPDQQRYEPLAGSRITLRPGMPLSGKWTFQLPGRDKKYSVMVPHVWNALPGLEHYRGRAVYSTQVDVPAEWENKNIFLVLEGVAWTADVTVNGQLTGSVSDGRFATRVDITEALDAGKKNIIEVSVSNASPPRNGAGGRSVKNFGGLFREPYLEARATSYVERLQVRAVRLNMAPPRVALRVVLRLPVPGVFTLTGHVLDPDGRFVEGFQAQVSSDEDSSLVVRDWVVALPGAQPWRPQQPDMYEFAVSLMSEDLESDGVTIPFGLRTFEARNGRFLFNGDDVYLRGVDYEAQAPGRHGPVMTLEEMEKDLRMIRAAGFNAVRVLNRPPHPAFLDLCDQQGLLVLEEIPIENPAARDLRGPAMLDRARRLLRKIIHRDATHPSVVMWGLGSGLDTNNKNVRTLLSELQSYARALDPSRPTYVVPAPEGLAIYAKSRAAASMNAGLLDRRGRNRRFAGILDTLLDRAQDVPTLVFGLGAHGLPGDNTGAGLPGSEQNQLLLIANSRLEADYRENLDGDFIHTFADYSAAQPLPGRSATASTGLVSRDRVPKAAYLWLEDYAQNKISKPPQAARARLPVRAPVDQILVAFFFGLFALIVWSGFGAAPLMFVAPHEAGAEAPPPAPAPRAEPKKIEFPAQGKPGSGGLVAARTMAPPTQEPRDEHMRTFLRFGFPGFLAAGVCVSVFLDLLLQRALPLSEGAPAWAGIWPYLFQASLPARLAFSFTAQAWLLCVSGVFSALLLKRNIFACVETAARCLVPRMFWFVPLLLPRPLPLFLMLVGWELVMRGRALRADGPAPAVAVWTAAIAAPAAALALAAALLQWGCGVQLFSALKAFF